MKNSATMGTGWPSCITGDLIISTESSPQGQSLCDTTSAMTLRSRPDPVGKLQWLSGGCYGGVTEKEKAEEGAPAFGSFHQ